MTLVKICGLKTVEDARAALDAGADFLGFVFYRPSHRYVDPATAADIVRACHRSHRRSAWRAVGVFVDEPLEAANRILVDADLDLAQLCGAEDRTYCQALLRPAVRVAHVTPDGRADGFRTAAAYGAERLLLDTGVPGKFGGTGQSYLWSSVHDVARESFLAGGLTVENVGAAVRDARPWAVDVSSGVERQRRKDPELIRQFIQEVRRVDECLSSRAF